MSSRFPRSPHHDRPSRSSALSPPRPSRPPRVAASLEVLGLGALCLASMSVASCHGSDGAVLSKPEEAEIAALLADGDLSAMPGAMSKPPTSRLPDRFCPDPSGGGTGGKGGGTRPPPVSGGPGGAGGFDVGGAGGIGGFDVGGAGGFDVGGSGGVGGFDVGGAGGIGGFGGAGGAGGAGNGNGSGMEFGDCSLVPLAHWTLDDCVDTQTTLSDTAFTSIQHPAFRTLSTACEAAINNFGVRFAGNDDVVYAPDQPDFMFDRGITVGAWIKPDKLGGVQNIARKRQDSSSSFVLALDGNKLTFALQLTSGRSASVSTPFKTAGVWTHVAATFDGKQALLYVNGALAAKARINGVLSNGVGPIFVGNDASGRRLKGLVDDVWLNNLASPPDVIAGLTCVQGPPQITLAPTASPPTTAGSSFTFDLSIGNTSTSTCAPLDLQLFPSFPQGLLTSLPNFVGPVAPGQTLHVPVVVSTDPDLDAGAFPFSIFAFSNQSLSQLTQVDGTMNVLAGNGCRVSKDKELFIRDVSVVDDPLRTSSTGAPSDPRTGAWTFARFMERLAPRPQDAPDVAEAIFRSFTTTQTVNGFKVAARPGFAPMLDAWPRTKDGKLDLTAAPLLLDAVVNRLDLRDLAHGNAGEGRFVFNFVDQRGGFPRQATLIMEYTLPASTQADIQGWADAWHALASHPFPSEEYNVALQAITDRITARDAVAGATNGSGILRIRTNEIDFGGGAPWELREFNFDTLTGFMVPATIKVTPDLGLNGSKLLSDFMNANASDILLDRHAVPETFQGTAFLGGAVLNNIQPWSSDGSVDNEVRHHFSLNTCNGCHGGETFIKFTQVDPRSRGSASNLSPFLTGFTVSDPFTRQPRTFNDLGRRRDDLMTFVCPTAAPAAAPATGGATPTPAKGISRTE